MMIFSPIRVYRRVTLFVPVTCSPSRRLSKIEEYFNLSERPTSYLHQSPLLLNFPWVHLREMLITCGIPLHLRYQAYV